MIQPGRLCFWWMALLVGAGAAAAQPAVRIGDDFDQLFLTTQVALLEDSTHKLTIREVVRMPFTPNNKASINLSFTLSYYWVKFQLYNPDSSGKQLLLEVENPHLNKLRLYTEKDGTIRPGPLTGDHFPFAQRPVRHPHFLFPLSLPPGVTTYYLWADKHGEQLQIPLRLWRREAFEATTDRRFLLVGSMLGINCLYGIISLLVFLFFRQKITFYYCLYTIFAALFLVAHTGLGFEYLWPEATWWASAARPTCAMGMYIFTLLFARRFFNLSGGHRFLDWFTKGLIGLFVLLLLVLWAHNPALHVIDDYWYNPVYYSGEGLLVFMKAVNLSAFVFLLSLPLIGIYFYFRYRKIESLWFSLGNTMLLVGGISIILVFAGYLPDNYITQNTPLLTNALETVIMSFLLANRFKNIYQQNAVIAADLAEQRRQNAIQLLEGQAQERKRLSQELHDGLSLSIANIRLRLSLIADRLNGDSREADALVEDLGQVGQDVRQFSHALSPILLERHGLVEALDDLLFGTQLAHPDLAIDFEQEGLSQESLLPMVQQSVYQIVIELVNNTVRHAQATQLTIRLTQSPTELVLDVEDNGVGYEPGEGAPGIGLANIHSRADLFGGSFRAERLSKGMRHVLRIPV